MKFISFLFSNNVLNSAVLGWCVAQFLKGLIATIQNKKLSLERFFGAGGMPSSHGAFVASLSASVFLKSGYASTEFALSVVFAFIVIYDASGVRYAVGQQAKVINNFLSKEYEISDEDKQNEKALKEYIGHTKSEVFVGCILGILISFVYYLLLNGYKGQ